jgi:hypothetical protein
MTDRRERKTNRQGNGLRFGARYSESTAPRCSRSSQPAKHRSTMAALALLVAESAPKDKEVMIRLVMNVPLAPQP